MGKREEMEQIYGKWLMGMDIHDLAREYRHWRSTIEQMVREMVLEVECQGRQIVSASVREIRELNLAVAKREFARRCEKEGINAAERWSKDYQEGSSVIRKSTAIGLTQSVYDEDGLWLDVVPIKPDECSEVVES